MTPNRQKPARQEKIFIRNLNEIGISQNPPRRLALHRFQSVLRLRTSPRLASISLLNLTPHFPKRRRGSATCISSEKGSWALVCSGRRQVTPGGERPLGTVVQTGRLIMFAIFGQRWLARRFLQTPKRRYTIMDASRCSIPVSAQSAPWSISPQSK